jgi:hypothetical protein
LFVSFDAVLLAGAACRSANLAAIMAACMLAAKNRRAALSFVFLLSFGYS